MIYKKKWLNETLGRPPKHGLSYHPLYKTWNGMKERCYNYKHPSYRKYGAKGVIVCAKWRHDFVAFYLWSLANGWTPEAVLLRKNSTGNYTPANLEWKV